MTSNKFRPTTYVWVVLALVIAASTATANDQMLAYVQAKVEAQPNDASAWRMLGRLLLKRAEYERARPTLQRAVSLDASSAAAHFDLAECLMRLGDTAAAAEEFRRTRQLAPDSDYAREAAFYMDELQPPAEIEQVGFEVRRLDGSDLTSDLIQNAVVAQDPPAFYLHVEGGALYNSNVTLTPISRDFGAVEQASAQFFVNPTVEYRVVNNAFWTIGPSLTGYFNVNANNSFRSLNLQSYQPGLFAERTTCCPTTVLVSRLQYDYTLDQFDGITFGNRHAMTASTTSLWDSGDTSVVYAALNYTDFRDDSPDPSTGSRDGMTYSAGGSHTWPITCRWCSAITLGADLEWADVQGSDFSYVGGTLYAGIMCPITDTIWCDLEGGAGVRDYYESTIAPSRNESIWRGSAKITKELNRRWAISGVFNFDRFASDNALFEAQRYVAGLVTTYVH